jgi:hypothetical protein
MKVFRALHGTTKKIIRVLKKENHSFLYGAEFMVKTIHFGVGQY